MYVPAAFMIITSSVAPSAGCWMVRRYGKTGSEGCAFVLVSGACAIAGCASRASVAASKDRIYLNVLIFVSVLVYII